MKRKILSISTIIILLSITVLFSTPVRAQGTGSWIVNYTIADLKTGQLLRQVDVQSGLNTSSAPILAGAELNVTVTIQVATSSPNTNLQLSTSMGHSAIQGTYWELQTKNYAGISSTNYNPNQQTVTFTQNAGTLIMSCYGAIPAGITQTTIGGGIVLDKKADTQLIKLADPVGNQLDQIRVDVVDAKIDQYNTLLANAQDNIEAMRNNGVDPAYIALYQSVLDGAQNQANQGFVDNAIGVLNQLSSVQSGATPVSTNPIEATLFLPSVVALAVLVVLMGVLMMRARGKVSYDRLVIEDQIKDLEGLTLRAAKIDKNISISLESVKDRLKSLVGA